MLSNTITGEPWQRHVERQAEGTDDAESADEEDAEADERADRERTSAELRAEARARGEGMEVRRANAEKLIRTGCVTTIGTDNYLGSAPEFRRDPIKALNQSFGTGSVLATEGLVELGMTPMEAIVAVTRNGAIASRMLDELGTLEAGKLADILVLAADPLEDIRNIRLLETVIRDGRIVDLDALPNQRIFSHPADTLALPGN
jgi:imidazolonepropionase-like amidohydrolase